MSFPALNYLSNNARTEGEMKTVFEDFLKAVKQIPGAGVAEQSVTLASDQMTPTAGFGVFTVDTEGAAASDELRTIVQTNHDDGAMILLRIAASARIITVKHAAGGTGEISLATGDDFTLGDTDHWLWLKRNGLLWEEIARFPVPLFAPVQAKTSSYTTTAADRGRLIDCTSGTFTLSLLAVATAGAGFLQPVRNSGTGYITVDANSSETIDGALTLLLAPGDSALLLCDGSAWSTLGRSRLAQGSGRIIGGNSKNNASTPNTQFDLAADAVVLRDANNQTITRHNPSGVTCNISTAGPAANGRDQAGAFTAGSWVHVYWIYEPGSGTVASLASATAPPTGPTLPSGYTYWAYAGAVYFTSGSALRKVRLKGSWAYYEEYQMVLASGSATSETTVSVSTFVPPNALTMRVMVESVTVVATGGGAAVAAAKLRVVTGNDAYVARAYAPAAGQTIQTAGGSTVLPNISQAFIYFMTNSGTVSSSNVAVAVAGYQNPNGGE
jgi:hypothetical protein